MRSTSLFDPTSLNLSIISILQLEKVCSSNWFIFWQLVHILTDLKRSDNEGPMYRVYSDNWFIFWLVSKEVPMKCDHLCLFTCSFSSCLYIIFHISFSCAFVYMRLSVSVIGQIHIMFDFIDWDTKFYFPWKLSSYNFQSYCNVSAAMVLGSCSCVIRRHDHLVT